MKDTKLETNTENKLSDDTVSVDEAIPIEQDNEIEAKLDEADRLAESDSKRLTHDEVFG